MESASSYLYRMIAQGVPHKVREALQDDELYDEISNAHCIWLAVYYNREGLVKILLDESRIKKYLTVESRALQEAYKKRNVNIIKLLLRAINDNHSSI